MKRGDISLEEAEQALDDFQNRLQEALDQTRQGAPAETFVAKAPPPPIGVLPQVDTGVAPALLERVYGVMSHPPEGFVVHPKLARQFETRDKMFADGEVDWALAESLAFGTLLLEGTPLRIAGQDTRRGTFSQRHTVLVDYETGAEWAPLAHLGPDQAKFWIYDSLLSEYAAAGLRVRLLGRQQGRLRLLGGAVRRLHQRRPDRRSTSSSCPPRTSGTRPPGSSCCCRTASRGRAPSTRRRASSASSRSAPRTTSRWPTPPRRRSTSTCSAGRCTARCASRW